jgi:hypothetical protein
MVNEQQRIDVGACVGTGALLGSPMGEAHFPVLLGAILRYPDETIITLDFRGITNITASYVAATLVRLLRMTAARSLNRYLILDGVHEDYEREIAYVLNHENTPVLVRTNSGEQRVLGPLDSAYATTLQAVTERGKVTARELQAASKENIGQTGWIKRLTTLQNLGLVRRTKTGREYAYEPITMKESHG